MWKREPILVFLAGLDALVVGLLSAASVLGWVSIDGAGLAAVSAAVVAVTGFIGGVLRSLVYSPAEHEGAVTAALYLPVPGDELDDIGPWPAAHSDVLEGL